MFAGALDVPKLVLNVEKVTRWSWSWPQPTGSWQTGRDRSQICFAPGKSKTPISLGGQTDIKEKSFLFAASVHSLEPRSLLEQTVLEILESYDCVSHFVPRTEYLVKHFAATHWRRRHQLFPVMHTPGRSYPVLFSLHGGLQEMPLSSYVFPPDSVKPLLGCGHSFSFLCTLVE